MYSDLLGYCEPIFIMDDIPSHSGLLKVGLHSNQQPSLWYKQDVSMTMSTSHLSQAAHKYLAKDVHWYVLSCPVYNDRLAMR